MRGLLPSQQEQEAPHGQGAALPRRPHTLTPTCPSLRASQDSCLRSESSGCNPFLCSHPGKHHPSGEPLCCTAKEAVSPPRSSPRTPSATSRALSLKVASGSLRLPIPPPTSRSEQRPPPARRFLPPPRPARYLRRPRRSAPSSRAPAGAAPADLRPLRHLGRPQAGGELGWGACWGATCQRTSGQGTGGHLPGAEGCCGGHPQRAWLTQPT